MDYENENSNNNKEFFEKINIVKEVDIYREKYINRYQGKYPVVYFDINEIEIGNSYEKTINNIKKFICDIYNKYKGIKIGSLTEYEKKKNGGKIYKF